MYLNNEEQFQWMAHEFQNSCCPWPGGLGTTNKMKLSASLFDGNFWSLRAGLHFNHFINLILNTIWCIIVTHWLCEFGFPAVSPTLPHTTTVITSQSQSLLFNPHCHFTCSFSLPTPCPSSCLMSHSGHITLSFYYICKEICLHLCICTLQSLILTNPLDKNLLKEFYLVFHLPSLYEHSWHIGGVQ